MSAGAKVRPPPTASPKERIAWCVVNGNRAVILVGVQAMPIVEAARQVKQQ